VLTGLIQFVVVDGYTYINCQCHIDSKALKPGFLSDRPTTNRLRPASKRGRMTGAGCTRSMMETTNAHFCVGHPHHNYRQGKRRQIGEQQQPFNEDLGALYGPSILHMPPASVHCTFLNVSKVTVFKTPRFEKYLEFKTQCNEGLMKWLTNEGVKMLMN